MGTQLRGVTHKRGGVRQGGGGDGGGDAVRRDDPVKKLDTQTQKHGSIRRPDGDDRGVLSDQNEHSIRSPFLFPPNLSCRCFVDEGGGIPRVARGAGGVRLHSEIHHDGGTR